MTKRNFVNNFSSLNYPSAFTLPPPTQKIPINKQATKKKGGTKKNKQPTKKKKKNNKKKKKNKKEKQNKTKQSRSTITVRFTGSLTFLDWPRRKNFDLMRTSDLGLRPWTSHRLTLLDSCINNRCKAVDTGLLVNV